MDSTQVSIPFELNHSQIVIQEEFQDALQLCYRVAGYKVAKQITDAMGMNKSQTSCWFNGESAPKWPQLCRFMDICGNDAPLLWMLHQRGYDLNSLRKRESENEKRIRELSEQVNHLQHTILSLGQHANRLAA